MWCSCDPKVNQSHWNLYKQAKLTAKAGWPTRLTLFIYTDLKTLACHYSTCVEVLLPSFRHTNIGEILFQKCQWVLWVGWRGLLGWWHAVALPPRQGGARVLSCLRATPLGVHSCSWLRWTRVALALGWWWEGRLLTGSCGRGGRGWSSGWAMEEVDPRLETFVMFLYQLLFAFQLQTQLYNVLYTHTQSLSQDHDLSSISLSIQR